MTHLADPVAVACDTGVVVLRHICPLLERDTEALPLRVTGQCYRAMTHHVAPNGKHPTRALTENGCST